MHSTQYIDHRSCSLYTNEWTVDSPKAIVLLVHGLGEYSGRYTWTSQQFNEAGYSVYSYDQRGHGHSDGRRSYIEDFDTLVNDFEYWKNQLSIDPNLPLFIYAHSMGALMISKYVLDRKPSDIRGIVFSGGALKVHPDLSPLLQKLAPIIGTIIPKLKTVGLDPSLVSKDQAVVDAYRNDPLINHEGTYAKTGHIMLKTIKYVQSKFDQWQLPVLIMHGGSDRLIDPNGSKMMYEKIPVKDKKLLILDDLYHEIMREPEKEKVLSTMIDWIDKRL